MKQIKRMSKIFLPMYLPACSKFYAEGIPLGFGDKALSEENAVDGNGLAYGLLSAKYFSSIAIFYLTLIFF